MGRILQLNYPTTYTYEGKSCCFLILALINWQSVIRQKSSSVHSAARLRYFHTTLRKKLSKVTIRLIVTPHSGLLHASLKHC